MSSRIKCIIVDDEPLAIRLLEEHIKQVAQLELVATADNPVDALNLLKKVDVDLVFLDIEMPVLTGIELVKTLSDPPGIIFTTAYREYAVESYELNVFDYLMKPITFIRFLKAVNKFIAKSESNSRKAPTDNPNSDKSIYVNVNKKYVKVNFSDIDYVESVKDYIHIHVEENTIVTKETISHFEEKLGQGFLRIHRSFIVNLAKVTAFTALDVEIGRKELPIGSSYKEAVKKRLTGTKYRAENINVVVKYDLDKYRLITSL